VARFEDLEVWKRSARLSAKLYQYFQSSKNYGSKFPTYAKGSCAELWSQIYIGIEAGYIDKEQGTLWVQETMELSRMLFGLIKYLKRTNPLVLYPWPLLLTLRVNLLLRIKEW